MRPEQISITIEATPVLSYAMAHNEIPAVSRLTIDRRRGRRAGRDAAAAGRATPTGRSRRPQELLLDLDAGAADGAHRPRPGAGPGRDAAGRGAAARRRSGPRLEVGRRGRRPSRRSAPGCSPRTSGWPRRPPLALEMLAAHVMPNHPAVTALLAEVADRLRASTGSPAHRRATRPARSGSTRSSTRSPTAMQARGIRYASRRRAGPTSARRSARRARCSTGGSAPAWTPSSSWPPRWSRPASGRCCLAASTGPRVPRLLAGGVARCGAVADRRRAAWSTWSTSG